MSHPALLHLALQSVPTSDKSFCRAIVLKHDDDQLANGSQSRFNLHQVSH